MPLAFLASPFETTMWCPGPSFLFLSPSYPPNENTQTNTHCAQYLLEEGSTESLSNLGRPVFHFHHIKKKLTV